MPKSWDDIPDTNWWIRASIVEYGLIRQLEEQEVLGQFASVFRPPK